MVGKPPFHTPKWSFLVGKPMEIVGETHHFRVRPHVLVTKKRCDEFFRMLWAALHRWMPQLGSWAKNNASVREKIDLQSCTVSLSLYLYIYIHISRWGVQIFLIVIPIWENDPIWPIFSDGVETTNHVNSLILQGIKSMPYLWLNILYIDENGCFSSELNIFDGLTFFANDLPQQNWLSRTFVWLNIPYHPCMVYSPTFSWCLW